MFKTFKLIFKSNHLFIGIADGLWASVIKYRAGFTCEVCGSKNSLNSHHIITRHNLATRYDLDNGICLCENCHIYNRDSAHKQPELFKKLISTKRKNLNKLEKRAKNKVKYNILDLIIIILYLQEEKQKFYDFKLK